MKSVLHILLLSLLSFHIFAADDRKISSDEIEQYMVLSGIDEMIDSMPAQIEAMANQKLLTAKDPDAEKEVMQLLKYAWNSEKIKNSIIEYIQNNSSEKELGALLDWRETPLAKKIIEAEAGSSSPNFQNNLLRYIADLQVAPPSSETIQAVRRVVDSTDMVEMMVEMAVQVTESMMTAFMKADPTGVDMAGINLDEQIDSMKMTLRPVMEQQAILVSYYLYRNISDEELNSYASFYESQLGRRELKLVSESLTVAMSLWAEQSAKAIIESMQENQ